MNYQSNFAFLVLSLLILAACGKAGKMPEAQFEQVSLPADGSNIKGVYKVAPLLNLNTNSLGFTNASSVITRTDDTFTVYVHVPKSYPNIWHKQDIYIGGRCPTDKDDANNDGFVDIQEARRVMGKIIIPLDGNLESQKAGSGSYPYSDGGEGAYFYKESASFERLFADLKAKDSTAADDVIKLKAKQGLAIDNAIIVIHGASYSANLPDTVATADDLENFQSIPIACGLYGKTGELPAGTDRGETSQMGQAETDNSTTPAPTPSQPDPTTPQPPRPPQPPRDNQDGQDPDDDDDQDGTWDRIRDWFPDGWIPGRRRN